MRKKRRTVVTLEIDEVLFVKRGGVMGRTQCGECAAETVMITPEEAAATLGISTRLIYRWIEGKRIHFTEMPSGSLCLCLSSLLANIAEGSSRS